MASSNTRVKVEMYLKMENLYALFDQIISGDDVKRKAGTRDLFESLFKNEYSSK